MSTRRSSRHPPPPPSHTASSTSSVTMKNTRAAKRSESIDEINTQDDETSQAPTDSIVPRRSRRTGLEEQKDGNETSKPDNDDEEETGEQDTEEEITRCICGQADFPGPNVGVKEMAKGIELEALGDDLGGFFVQCDICSVWQHGGCMGLIDENNLPEEYYCEQCKPELHRIIRGSNTLKSSRYLPVLQQQSSRSSSSSTTSETRKRDPNRRVSENTKRRATLNSRVAYDEDEMLRRAIEESKGEVATLGKRTRDEAVDDPRPQPTKRQRTASTSSERSGRSVSPLSGDDGSRSRPKQNLRGAAAKNSKEKESRDKQKEVQAQIRAEAANKRHARSERRRVDDSPPPTPSLSPSKHNTKVSSKSGTPPPSQPVSRPKSKRPAPRKRLGRNQYTRDLPNGIESDAPMRDTSHDRSNHTTNGNGNSPNGITGHANGDKTNGGSGRSSKAKTHPARTSMNEMKRRVAAILEFVGQLQQTPPNSTSKRGSANGSAGSKGANTPLVNGKSVNHEVDAEPEAPSVAGGVAAEGLLLGLQQVASGTDSGPEAKLKMKQDVDFRGLESKEMMDTLVGELEGWQNVYGAYSR